MIILFLHPNTLQGVFSHITSKQPLKVVRAGFTFFFFF